MPFPTTSGFFLLLFAYHTVADYTEIYNDFSANNARLYSKLFKNYIKDLAPTFTLGSLYAPDDYAPMPIFLDLNFFTVTKVIVRNEETMKRIAHSNDNPQWIRSIEYLQDQMSQSAEVVISMQVTWIDRRLVWNPADYGQVPYILVKSDSIWQPNISPCAASSRENVDDDKTSMAKVYSNGTVNIMLNWAISYSCEMVMSNFPFDSHTCRMCFFLHKLTSHEAIFQISPYYNPLITNGMVNNEWALVSLNAELVKEFFGSVIYFDCSIIRHPTFWVQLVIIPAYFLGVLIITGLFLGDHDEEVGAAINYGLAVMMSITVIIGILADGLPKSSALPVLGKHERLLPTSREFEYSLFSGYFVLGQFIIVCIAVLFVVLRREIKKGILSIVTYVSNKKIEKDLLKGLIQQKNRSKHSKILLTCVQFVVRVVSSNYLAFIIFQLMHALNLIFVLNAFNSEKYQKAMDNSALTSSVKASETFKQQY